VCQGWRGVKDLMSRGQVLQLARNSGQVACMHMLLMLCRAGSAMARGSSWGVPTRAATGSVLELAPIVEK
jgi:hypothetical protein